MHRSDGAGMSKPKLSTFWVRWRRTRFQTLIADGLANRLAWPLARAEARRRSRIARIIGNERACAAELIRIGDTFALEGSLSGLTEEQQHAMSRLNIRLALETA